MTLAAKRLSHEMRKLQEARPSFVLSVGPKEPSNILLWEAVISGPQNTAYQGGIFKFRLEFPQDYPLRPPKVTALQRIFHPNISSSGMICLNTLKVGIQDGWRAALTIEQIMIQLHGLLLEPNAEDPVVESIAALLRNDAQEFKRKAKLWTERFASGRK